MLLEWMMNGHAILYTGVTLAFWSTILIVGKIMLSPKNRRDMHAMNETVYLIAMVV